RKAKLQNQKGGSSKDWILRYAEQSSDSGDSDAGNEEDEDPNSRYLVLTTQIEDAKNEAADAKLRGDKSAHSKASKCVRELTLERDAISRHPGFNPSTKLQVQTPVTKKPSEDKELDEIEQIMRESEPQAAKDTTRKSGKKVGGGGASRQPATGGDDEEEGFNLFGFDKMEEKAAAAKAPSCTTAAKAEDVRQFEYTRQQWTGKHPKQFLIDWCRKHLPKVLRPKYQKIQCRYNRFKCRVTVDRQKDGLLQVCPDILCENAKEAEMLGCTLALYHLCRGQSVHQLLPPPYRAVWLEWLDAEQSAQQEAKEKENKPRDQFVSRLMKKLKMEDSDSGSAQQSTSLDVPSRETLDPPKSSSTRVNTDHKMTPSSESLRCRLQDLHGNRQHQELLKTRRELPVFQFRQSVLDHVHKSNVVVVAGETGSGKSTQVPQFVLEDLIHAGRGSDCNIVVTQPRRISAISLASRVSEEIGESSKERRNNLCGYQIRFESRKSSTTRLTYCTTGVVLRQLQTDRDLSNVSHLIIDEVHERSVQSDFLLTVVKGILGRRPDLKVILMSATLDSGKFSAYFSHCPVLNIPGRTFPVEVKHIEDLIEMTGYVADEDSPYTLKHSQLVEEESTTVEVTDKRGETNQMELHWTREDIGDIDRTSLSADRYSKRTRNAVTRLNPDRINMDLIMDVLKHLESAPPYCEIDGAVLIFLPGLADIQELYEILTTDRHFSDTKKFQIFALHSVLSSEDQGRVFAVPPAGIRKIVLATNIAETGITIPDVVFVIDSGKVKENRYNERSQMSSLIEVFISKANAKQRQGRAGRVRDGFCFRLYTAEKYHKMAEFTLPEILRVPLEELCLLIMKCELGKPEEFLAGGLDPPQPSSVQRAMSLLYEVGACFADTRELTPLGHHLASLPVNVRIGKMLIYAAILGCLEPVAVIAAAMTDKSPFVVPLSRREEANAAKLALSTAASDHLTLYRAYKGWCLARSQSHSAENQYCGRHFLKRNTLLDIENVKNDLIKLVYSIGFTTHSSNKQHKTSDMPLPDVLDISKVSSKTHDLDQQTVAMVKAVLCAGLYSQVAKVTPVDSAQASAHPGERKPCLAETAQGHTQVHPSSVNRFLMLHSVAWFVYGEKVKVSRVYVRDTTVVSAYPLLLFGGDINVQHLQKLLVIDNWIKYKAVAKTGVIFKELRTLFDKLLERKLAEPRLNLTDDRLIRLITELIKSEKPTVKL
ncbi:hypothetical protein BaRGS_00038228, partial [Batillaria attramentaria]